MSCNLFVCLIIPRNVNLHVKQPPWRRRFLDWQIDDYEGLSMIWSDLNANLRCLVYLEYYWYIKLEWTIFNFIIEVITTKNCCFRNNKNVVIFLFLKANTRLKSFKKFLDAYYIHKTQDLKVWKDSFCIQSIFNSIFAPVCI